MAKGRVIIRARFMAEHCSTRCDAELNHSNVSTRGPDGILKSTCRVYIQGLCSFARRTWASTDSAIAASARSRACCTPDARCSATL